MEAPQVAAGLLNAAVANVYLPPRALADRVRAARSDARRAVDDGIASAKILSDVWREEALDDATPRLKTADTALALLQAESIRQLFSNTPPDELLREMAAFGNGEAKQRRWDLVGTPASSACRTTRTSPGIGTPISPPA